MLPPGERIPSPHSFESRQRILAGLSWDPREETTVGMFSRFFKGESQHDLDISCYIYDREGNCVDYVGAEAQDSMDQSGKIYHSGDDVCGSGGGDDERISAELGELPTSVKGIVFLIEVRSNHAFQEIANPSARLVDGLSMKEMLVSPIESDASEGKNAFVFCSLYRDNDNSPTGWMLHHIADFPDIEKIDDWGNYLSRYIS